MAQGRTTPATPTRSLVPKTNVGDRRVLNHTQREIVEQVIREHSELRRWHLHAVNCRSNHCHVVVTAPDEDGEQVRDQFKAWATRRLKKHERENVTESRKLREHWWTRKGSVRKLFDEESVEAAWDAEIDSRVKEIEEGKVELVSADDAIERVRSKLADRRADLTSAE